jgi:hypothetical protein
MGIVYNLNRGPRPGRFPGLGYTKRDCFGRPSWSSWPRKRGPKATPNQLFQRMQSDQAMSWSTSPVDMESTALREMSEGAPWTWRDIYISCMYGKVIEGTMADGSYFGSFRLVAASIQQMLDTITNNVGSLLVRTDAGWVGLDAGATGDVLTSKGLGQAPDWEPGGGGGGSGWYQPALLMPVDWTGSHGIDTGEMYFAPFYLQTGAIIGGVVTAVNSTNATSTLDCALYSDGGGAPSSLLATSETTTGVAPPLATVTFDTPYEVEADGLIWLAFKPGASSYSTPTNHVTSYITSFQNLPFPSTAPSILANVDSGNPCLQLILTPPSP